MEYIWTLWFVVFALLGITCYKLVVKAEEEGDGGFGTGILGVISGALSLFSFISGVIHVISKYLV